MKAIKGLAVGILSLLLFLSLSVFGLAFTLQSTVLNPGFVTAEVDRIDIPALVKDIAGEDLNAQLPAELPFLQDAIYKVIEEQEPLLKEQINSAIRDGYAYLLGRTGSLNIIISLAPLKAGLKDSLWQATSDYLESDISVLAEDMLKPVLEQHLPELIGQLPPEYLPPGLDTLPEDQLQAYLDQHFAEIIRQIPAEQLPPEITGLLREQIEPYFNQYYDSFAGQIPDSFVIDEDSVPPEVMTQLVLTRQYIGYFQTGYYALLGFMVLLVLAIILINRNLRHSTLALGITLILYGALELAGVYFTRNSPLPTSLPLSGVPPSLETWLNGLATDLLAPLQTLSLGILAGGIVLLVISFVYRPGNGGED